MRDLSKAKVHASITPDRVYELAREQMFGLESPGLCIACGEESSQVEPDAERYTCEACDGATVYGMDVFLQSGLAGA